MRMALPKNLPVKLRVTRESNKLPDTELAFNVCWGANEKNPPRVSKPQLCHSRFFLVSIAA